MNVLDTQEFFGKSFFAIVATLQYAAVYIKNWVLKAGTI